MKEYVLVEFLAVEEDRNTLIKKLHDLGEDFQFTKDDFEFETDDAGLSHSNWYRISGRISSMYASVIKLQDSFLAERMRISYIPDELKEKYRKLR